jgi:hypothetical protein
LPDNPDLPHITVQGSHSLQARDFIEYRPDTLHRRLLSQHLLDIIANGTNPIPVSTLYTLSPHSSPFQIQRSINELLRMGQIQRPARGFYSPAPATPVIPVNVTAATSPIAEPTSSLNPSAAITLTTQPVGPLDSSATITSRPQSATSPNSSATKRPHKGRSRHKNTKKRR